MARTDDRSDTDSRSARRKTKLRTSRSEQTIRRLTCLSFHDVNKKPPDDRGAWHRQLKSIPFIAYMLAQAAKQSVHLHDVAGGFSRKIVNDH